MALAESKDVESVTSRSIDSKKEIKKTNIKRFRGFIPKGKSFKAFKKKKKIPLKDVRPPSSSKLYYPQGTDEAELESTINEEIRYLYKLYRKKPTADIMLRLGSVYVEKAKFISFKLQLDHEKELARYQAGERKTKPALNLRTAETYNRKALRLFQKLRAEYPKHRRMDEILFFLGFNSYQLSKRAQSEKYFRELEQRFPKSEYLYESWFQLGEHYFQRQKWKDAFAYYRKVSKNKNGKFYFLATYKMSWTYYKRGYVTKGLRLLEKLIREAEGQRRGHKQRFTFITEATQDLVLFYTYSKQPPSKAKSFFLKILDDKTAWQSLKKLAYAYRDTGHISGTRVLFSQLIDRDPMNKQAFDYKYQIVHTAYSSGSLNRILKELKEWINDYGPSSNWARANARDKKLMKKSFALVESTLRNYALKNHQTYRISKRSKELNIALGLYKLYFAEFKNFPDADQIFFFYGELLFDSKQYGKAITAYERVIKNYPNSKYVKPSYINQLLAAEKGIPNIKKIEALAGKSKKPVSIPREIKNFQKIADRYLKKYPKAKNTATINYRLGAYFYKLNHFELATKYLDVLLKEHPKSELISSVGSLLLDIYNKTKDFRSLELAAKEFSKSKTIDKELAQEARFVLEQLSFKKAQDLAVEKKYKEAADLYYKFAKSNSNGPLAYTAFYNAGINYEKVKDIKQASVMYSSVLTYKSKANEKAYKKSAEFSPVLQEKLGYYKSAANGYTYYAKKFPNSPKAVDYWYNASLIFDALNMVKSATFTYNKYYTTNKSAERHEALYLLGALYERMKNWNKAIHYYKLYSRSGSKQNLNLIKSSYKLAKLYETKKRDKAKANYWYRNTLTLYKKRRAGVFYGASAHFHEVRKTYDKFLRIKIPRSPKLQKSAVDRKIKLLNSLEVGLRPVIRYNDGANVIASLALLGLANQKMAEAIYNTPIPAGLNKEGKKQYKEGIKKLISPYIKKSIDSYELALKKAESFKVYSQWLDVVHTGLASIVLNKNKTFKDFDSFYVEPETSKLVILDNKGSITTSFLQTTNDSLKYGVSKEDLQAIATAIRNKEESKVLEATSVVLNKDPDNVLAINSLALFYLKNNKAKLATLIMNRALSKNKKDPILLNNIGIIALRYKEDREAFGYFQEALKADRGYHIAKINLANLFLKTHDYENAAELYKSVQGKVFSPGSRQEESFLNNYGVSLMGSKKWKTAYSIFKKLSSTSSPPPSFLMNYSIVLIRGLSDKRSLDEAKGLVSEMGLYSKSVIFKKKLDKLKKSLEKRLKK